MILVIFIFLILMAGVAMFFILGTKRSSSKQKVMSDVELEKQMKRKAQFCIESAATAFNKALDYTEDSIRTLDLIINDGWKGKKVSDVSKDKLIQTFGAYFGQTYINYFGGIWFQKIANSYPIIYNAEIDFEFSPFSIMKEKFEKLENYDLSIAYAELKTTTLKKIDAQK